MIKIDCFKMKDSNQIKYFIAFDEYKKCMCIFPKVSRIRAKRYLATDKNVKFLQRFLASTMVRSKPKVIGGEV